MSFTYTWSQYTVSAPHSVILDSIFVGTQGIIKRGTFGNTGTPNINLVGLKVSGASVRNACVWLENPVSDVYSSSRYIYMLPQRPLSAPTSGSDAPQKTLVKMMSPGWASPVVLEPCQMRSLSNIADLTVPINASSYFEGTVAVGSRVIVKDQSSPEQNGIYVVMTYDLTNVTLLRDYDMNCSSDLYSGAQVSVSISSTNHWYTLYVAGYSSTPTLGTTHLAWQAHSNFAGNGSADDNLVSPLPVRALLDQAISLSGLITVDGVQLVANDRVLVTGQASSVNNGVYTASSGSWSRATDIKTGDAALACRRYSVLEGSTYANRAFGVTLPSSSAVIGTDPIGFVEILSLSNSLSDPTLWYMWPNAPTSEDRAVQLGNASTDVTFTARTRKIAVGISTPTTEYDGLDANTNFASLYHDRLRLMSSFDVCPPGVQS
jgi:hypothetical protein